MLTLDNVKAAQARLSGKIHHTPLFYSTTLSKLSGNDVYLKCENLQKTGSFKVRGALNAVAQLTPKERAQGVVTGSSGNHGQALAFAAREYGVKAIVVMPEDATLAKRAACEGYGGTVLLCGITAEARLAKAADLVTKKGYTLVHPFDDPHIIAGQGTLSLEVLADLPDVDCIVVPVGGGGLLGGVSLSMKESSPRVQVVGVEPAISARLRHSWQAGAVTELSDDAWAPSIADGLRVRRPGRLPYALSRAYVDDLVTVTESEIAAAMCLIMERAKLVVEPSGAVSVAAALNAKLGCAGKKVVCVLSGGNVELAKLAKLGLL
ncbi:MAG: L-threonine dehydratase catabolic TdcB [Firmicutes bacterium]|nr:L-threonine dehydratase catabolic TdcB [candidate division NPL-UPA2 bacterium]